MFGLVQGELTPIGKPDCRHNAPPLLVHWATQLDAFGLEFLHGFLQVVAHQVELLAPGWTLGGMGRELRTREGKDQPPVTGVDRWETEDVGEEGPDPLGLGV